MASRRKVDGMGSQIVRCMAEDTTNGSNRCLGFATHQMGPGDLCDDHAAVMATRPEVVAKFGSPVRVSHDPVHWTNWPQPARQL